ncbi:MAG: hypothetical protein K8F58_04255, partial [Bauldia sp.]|nr:hypothetical protein [Bauldia sp.]
MREHGGRTVAIRTGLRALVFASALATGSAPGFGEPAPSTIVDLSGIGGDRIVLLAVLVGAVGFAVLSAIALMRARN